MKCSCVSYDLHGGGIVPKARRSDSQDVVSFSEQHCLFPRRQLVRLALALKGSAESGVGWVHLNSQCAIGEPPKWAVCCGTCSASRVKRRHGYSRTRATISNSWPTLTSVFHESAAQAAKVLGEIGLKKAAKKRTVKKVVKKVAKRVVKKVVRKAAAKIASKARRRR